MALSPHLVHEQLQHTAKRYKLSQGARFLISGTAVSLFFLCVFLLCDAHFHFGAFGRWLGFVTVVSSLAAGIALAWRATRPAISEASIARRVEKACQNSRNVLISAVQFDKQLAGNSPLRPALYGEMHDPFPGVDWSKVFNLSLLKKLGLALGIIAFILGMWALIKPGYFINSAARIFLPGSNIAPLTRTKVVMLKPGDAQVIRGRKVAVNLELGGEVPNSAWIRWREVGGSWQKALMDRDAGLPTFSFEWKEVREPMEYFIQAGDVSSASFRLTVRAKTAIQKRVAEVEFPAYTKLPKQVVENFNVLQNVVPGSKVTILLEFNNPLAELKAVDEKSAPLDVAKVSELQWRVSTTVSGNRTLKLDYKDTAGLMETESAQIITKADEAPKITVFSPPEGKELIAAPESAFEIKFTAADNFGLGSVALYRSTNEKQDAELVQQFQVSGKDYTGVTQVALKAYAAEERVTFCVVAKDQNDVATPGTTFSRPLVVTLHSLDKVKQQAETAVAKMRATLEQIIKLQQTNLDETRAAARLRAADLAPVLTRQVQILDLGRRLSTAADGLAPNVAADLRKLVNAEMQAAVLTLRNAAAAPDRTRFMTDAIKIESTILAKLQGSPEALANDATKTQIQDIIAGLDDLLRKQRDLLKATNAATEPQAKPLSTKQDALADQSSKVKGELQRNSENAALGDKEFRARLAQVAQMFGQLKIYEGMVTAAERLSGAQFPAAATVEKEVIVNLCKLIDVMNQWQLAAADKKAEELKKELHEMTEKLGKLEQIQRDIVEKTKEMARRSDMRPEDIAIGEELQKSKDLMKEVVEQMLTDAHVFPDLKAGNQLQEQLTQIFEDVQQADTEEIAKNQLKPNEIAVQKEDGLLKGIEEAKEISADMEMWVPNKSEREKWMLENFDKAEMPEMPMLPLPATYEDIVSDLLKTQEDIQQDIQDAASNQLFAQNPANGWEIRDGPMGTFGAQGKSGNEAPNHNEQTGRSSGGRDGMSNGEMSGDTVSKLEGDKNIEARRTNDPFQQGQLKDDGTVNEAKATGGGKVGGYSDRKGMEGNAPLRSSGAPPQAAADAAAVKEALLKEKTAKALANASMLYLNSKGLNEVVRLMDESEGALKDGRYRDFQNLHQKIVGRLKEVQGGIGSSQVVALPSADGTKTADKQLLGGSEGDAPPAYKDAVADYFRALAEEK